MIIAFNFGLCAMLSGFVNASSANAPEPPLKTEACPYTSSPCLKSDGTFSPNCLITSESPFLELMGIEVEKPAAYVLRGFSNLRDLLQMPSH